MKRPSPTTARRFHWVVALMLVMGLRGWAQFREWPGDEEKPTWFMQVPRVSYIETDVEAERDKFHSASGGSDRDSMRLYVSPRVGIAFNNYIYHPYLLTYSLLFEPGYVWQERSFAGQTSQSDQLLLNGTALANFLQNKPYATTLNFGRSHQEVKYDFFNTAMVDSQSWGAASGYREGPVPVTLSFQQTHEDSTDFNQTTATDQTLFNLNARNERNKDDLTELTYQYGQYDRDTETSGSSFRSGNSYHHLWLTDTEHFAKSMLKSAFRFDDRTSGGSSSSDLNATLDYNVEHSPTLRSYYDLSSSRFSGDGFDSIQNYGFARIEHKLYESLTSGLEVHGSTLSSSSRDSSLDSLSAGTTASVDYSKRLGTWGRLFIGNSTSFNLTDQQTTGAELLIANEKYTVPNSGLVLLTRPREISIISVTDTNNTPLQLSQDYAVLDATDPWQIQIFSTGPSHINAGATIFITYTVRVNPSGSYSVFANQFQIRLSLWEDMAAVYARYSFTDNRASSPEFLLQNDELFQAGLEFNWHRFKLSADYVNDHSTLFDYISYNLAEGYAVNLSPRSSLGLDLNQQWSVNTFASGTSAEQTQKLTFYNYMLHYEWHPTASLNWNVEVGYRQQRGPGLDQDLFAARTYLNWMLGKLQVHLGYEHGYQNIRGETTDRDFVFLRVKRTF